MPAPVIQQAGAGRGGKIQRMPRRRRIRVRAGGRAALLAGGSRPTPARGAGRPTAYVSAGGRVTCRGRRHRGRRTDATTRRSSTTPTTNTTPCGWPACGCSASGACPTRCRVLGELRTENGDGVQVSGAVPALAALGRPRLRRPGRADSAGHRRVRPPRLRPRQRRHRLAARLSVPDVPAAGRAARQRRRPAAMRGRGWQPSFPIGSQDAGTGRAASSRPSAGTRASRRTWRTGVFDLAGAVTLGIARRRPVVRDTNDGLRVVGPCGRAVCLAAYAWVSRRRAARGSTAAR